MKIKVTGVKNSLDLQQLSILLNDHQLTDRAGLILPVQSPARDQAIRMFVQENHVGMIKQGKRVVGMVVLSPWRGREDRQIAHHYELGYLLARQYWGQGIMTAAIKKLIRDLPVGITLHAQTAETNLASQQVLIKNGFLPQQADWWTRQLTN